MKFYLIANNGTLLYSKAAIAYPRWMLLAQQLTEQLLGTLEIRRHWRMDLSNRSPFVILDNGEYEGAQVSAEQLLKLTLRLEPDVLVLPDVQGDAGATRVCTSTMAKDLMPHVKHFKRPMRFMVVPQGDSPAEVLKEYEFYSGILDPKHYIFGIGLAYKLWNADEDPEEESGRLRMIDDLARLMSNLSMSFTYDFHLLGARWSPLSILHRRGLRILGVDSYKPCTCALNKISYPPGSAALKKYTHTDLDVIADDERLTDQINRFRTLYGCEQ